MNWTNRVTRNPVAVALASALCLALASEAQADIITIDPDTYGLGANLSKVAPGATLSVFTNVGSETARFDSVYAVEPNNPSAPTGSLVFGSAVPRYNVGNFQNTRAAERCISTGSCNGSVDGESAFSVFRIDFELPTDFVEVLSGFDSNYPDPISFNAYDRLGRLVGSCYGGGGGYLSPSVQIGDTDGCGVRTEFRYVSEPFPDQYFRFTIDRAERDIAYVLYGSTLSNWTPSIVDHLSYGVHSVPEPGTLALFSLGLAGLGFARRRKRA